MSPSSGRAERSPETDPDVSVILPCLDEAEFIVRCLESVLRGDFPRSRLEVLVIDGGSTDGTRLLVEKLQREYAELRIVDNPGGNKARAPNLGIAEATGDILIRIDAHATYCAGYVSTLVAALQEYEAANVGGVRVNLARRPTALGRALAATLSTSFGVGDAHHNVSVRPRRSSIVYLFCCRKEIFGRYGGFEERLLRGQDREFSLRLAANGERLFTIPSARVEYYVRSSLREFVPWAFECGRVPIRISRIMGRNLRSPRNYVPPFACICAAMLTGVGFFYPPAWWALAGLAAAYFVAMGLAIWRLESVTLDLGRAVLLPAAFILHHGLYGCGFLLEAVVGFGTWSATRQ